EQWDSIFYYVVRDLTGYGPLQVILEVPWIEDISCNGLDVPIFIWHRKYESIPTNIIFRSTQTLNDFLVKLAHKSGKHISSAQPVLDAMLPEKHRLAATFMKEVSMKGSTFCIRKFRAEPLSILDLIQIGTLSARIAAYFWLILEHKKSFMIVGGTGAGKTSMLNALLSLMSQNDKIVTAEEVPELSPPVSNWTQLNSRESFNFGDGPSGDITLFDLIKISLRYRPDYVIVGEVRGEEAYVLFQALATGHGGLCTMHADSIDRVVKRLTSPPMNVSEVYIPLMNVALYIQRVELPHKKDGLSFGRRVRSVSEIAEYDNYLEVSRWDPRTDTFTTMFKDSYILQQISVSSGKTMEHLLEELDRREQYIENMFKTGVENQREVAEKILSYYQNQREERENDTHEEIHEEIIEETIESGDIDDLLETSDDEIIPTENNWDNVDDLLNEIQGDDK
ncbi:MAG: type II/IV secretion system ATPase subunit, partial [Candidatus Thorarchaeota archaeon]